MKKSTLIFLIFIGMFACVLIYGGVKGSDWLREGSIEGWLWGLSVTMAFFIAVVCFINLHSKAVINAALNYPFKEGYLSWLKLIGSPALYAIFAYLFVMFLAFFIVWHFIYDQDSRTMAAETYFKLGNPFVYLIFSLLFAIIAVLFSIFVIPTMEKFTIRSEK